MTGSELLVHISAPSKVSDDKRYKQQVQGALAFDAVTRHDILTASRPVSPPTVHRRDFPNRNVRVPVAPLDESLAGVRLTNGEGSKTASSAITKKRTKVDHHTQYVSREGKSIVSILQNLNRNNTFPAVQVKQTPVPAKSFVQVKRTPAQSRKDKLPTNINEHFKRIRKTHNGSLDNSWETPPSVIPDSQPSRNPKHLKMSDDNASPSLFRSKQYGTQDGGSSQTSAASQSSQVHLDYPDCQGPADSQQTTPQAENSRPEASQPDELRLVVNGSVEDDYDPLLTSSQSLTGETDPQIETFEEFLSGERAQPRSHPPPTPHASSSSSSTQSHRLPPINTMIYYLPRPLPRHKRLKFATHLTPYLETLTSPTGAYSLSSTFTANILCQCPSFQQSSIWQRGNWSIPIASWPETAQTTFWENLKARITAGEAGWPGAVNVALKDGNVGSNEEEKVEVVKGSKGEEKRDEQALRVWIGCWAEMKREVWCLLWEASDGMVGRLGGRAKFWVDGRAVVVMK